MKRTDLLPLLLLLPLLGFVTLQVMQASSTTSVAQAAVLASDGKADARQGARYAASEASASPPVVTSEAASLAATNADGDARDLADVRRRLELGATGTYIGEILLERDSALARWPDRTAQPIHVWVGSGRSLEGWSDAFPARVREAFDEWSMLGIPVRFVFVRDSVDAEVHVSWIDHFDTPISGKTLWARDRNWWIVNGNITLALHHNGGEALDDKAIKAIALHEVGHLLGLDHTTDTANIMTARVRVRDLSPADRATMRLLYTVPPGSVK
ncbi:MAG TPA: matrixin family metalloprotease [Gemmatimonadaceae bacterium]|nr:matrixin family metalloprotease [Gemmatimonadaceae bacterium]